MALLQTPNMAFTKLSTLLVYLVNEIDRQAAQVPDSTMAVPCQACTWTAVSRGNMHAGASWCLRVRVQKLPCRLSSSCFQACSCSERMLARLGLSRQRALCK